MAKIIGRTEEIESLNQLYDSGKAELVAVYGRRRIGKTFLVDLNSANCQEFLRKSVIS